MASRQRQKRYDWLIRAGFLPSEAQQLSHASTKGIHAPYFIRMVNSRRALLLNAKRYGWTNEEYRNTIRKQYVDKGAIKHDTKGRTLIDVWRMLRYYEDKTPIPAGEAYDSPWRKRIQKQMINKRATKKVTRKQMLEQWVKESDKFIKRAEERGNIKRATQLKEQKAAFERQLKRLD
jgi:hypothetical protein